MPRKATVRADVAPPPSSIGFQARAAARRAAASSKTMRSTCTPLRTMKKAQKDQRIRQLREKLKELEANADEETKKKRVVDSEEKKGDEKTDTQ